MSGLLAYLPFFGAKPPLPAAVPTDEVIPVHLFDDTPALRRIVLVWIFQFDDVLDPEKLHAALSRLFQMDGWRKFSGRFRYRPDGSLEIHVPRACTEERPAVHFTQERHDCPMKEHPLASQIPRSTGKVATYPGPNEFRSLGLDPETPRSLDEFVSSGKPQFCLHVSTFADGTFVSVTHSHVSTDLMGMASILQAWSLVLAGKPEAVLPMMGYREDPFEGLWNPPSEQKHVLAERRLDGWRLAHWALQTVYESWRTPDADLRTLCVPKLTMENMMRDARKHVVAHADANSAEPTPFISEGDVLAALACRMLAQSQSPGSTRGLATYMVVDARGRAKSVFRQDAAYVQNSITGAFFFCTADKALKLPLGQLALLVREAIAAQTTEEQIKAFATLSAQTMRAGKMPLAFGDTDMAVQFISNRDKGGLAEKMDFSPAVLRDACPRLSRSKRGHPVYYLSCQPTPIAGKDYEANTWLSVSLPRKTWPDLTAYLEQFA